MTQSLLDSVSHVAEDERVTQTVLRAVADAKGVDPVDLDVPLNTVVDPDALDALLRSRPGERQHSASRVQFTYSGYEVSVHGTGRVAVSDVKR